MSTRLNLPKSVITLEKNAVSCLHLTRLRVDKENSGYASDGQCVYKKENKELVVGVAKSGTLKVSNKVEIISDNGSVFGVTSSGTVYFRGTKPPEIDCPGTEPSVYCAFVPVFCKMAVPKAALSSYQTWCRKWMKFYME